MKIVKFSKQEKRELWRKIPVTFEEKMATKQYLDEKFSDVGIASRYLEMMLWQIDTLYLLSELSDVVVWKGGTCIQSYLEPGYQRYSVDIDLNTSADKDSILNSIERLNERLENDGRIFRINGIYLGGFTFHSENDIIGVLNFFRLVPFKHGGEYYFNEIKIFEVVPIRIQFNYKFYRAHGFLSLKKLDRSVMLAPYSVILFDVKFPHESPEDLIADKLIAMAEITGIHRGRLRFKDVYDIIAMIENIEAENIRWDDVRRKLILISESWSVDYEMLIDRALNSMSEISRREFEVLGLKGSTGLKGYSDILLKWGEKTRSIIGLLRDEL